MQDTEVVTTINSPSMLQEVGMVGVVMGDTMVVAAPKEDILLQAMGENIMMVELEA